MAASLRKLFARARFSLGITQNELARRLGASRRTGQRWSAGEAAPKASQLALLAQQLAPIDDGLASEIAARAGTSLEALGASESAGVPPAAAAAASALVHVVDTIVCAAADEASVPPNVMRRALHAALVRARDLGVAPVTLEQALQERA